MKLFLIFWALGLSACNILDRSYLPPPGFEVAGGLPENLDLPLEFPDKKSPTTIGPGVNRKFEGSSTRPDYSNIAIGINRQGPQVISSESYETGTGVPFSENVYNVPSTTPSYALIQTTTVAPIESYETTVGFINNQGYPSKTLSINPNLNGSKFLNQQNFEVDTPQGLSNDFRSNIPVYASQDTNSGPFLRFSNGSYNEFPGYKESKYRKPVSSSLRPQDITNSDYQSGQYRKKFDNKPEVNARTPYPNFNNGNKSAIDNTQQSPEIYMKTRKPVENFNAKDFYGPAKTKALANLAPNRDSTSSKVSTPIEIKSSEQSSTPTASLRDDFDSYYSTANRPERVQDKSDRNAIILNYENLLTSDGFAYSYDTSNGIHADESGTAANGVRAQGSYSYIGDDGKVYSITYTADENGFLPRGDHLPTAPPIPNAILKVIEQAAKNKQSGVIDDGSYDDSKYGDQRYQGFIGRKPQDHKYTLFKRPTNSEKLRNDNILYRNDESVIDSLRNLNDADTGNKITISSERPNLNVENIYKKNDYSNEEMKPFIPLNKYDDNRMFVNKQLIGGPNNNLRGTSKTIYGQSVPPRSQYDSNNQNTGIKSTSIIQDNDENLPGHVGYKYNTPQSVFQPYEVNTLQPFLQNSNPESIESSSESFIGDTQDFPANKQLITQNSKYPAPGKILPSKTYNKNGYKDLAYPKNSYNNGNGVEEAADTIFSTPKPVYGSTSSGPFYYKSKITNNEEQQNNYPSSTYRPQFSSTTPLTSEFFSQSSSTTDRPGYSVTTPTSDQFISTLRPSISSETPGSILRTPGQGIIAIRTSTARPGFINKTNGRFGNRYRPTETVTYNDRKEFVQLIPQRKNEMKAGLDVSDLRTENFRESVRPDNIGTQSTTERVIGENFSGPKQPQRYDPEHGYYY